jgi:hypothetical protein
MIAGNNDTDDKFLTSINNTSEQLSPVTTALAINLFLQVLRAFGIPQKKKHLYFISVSGVFLGTSLPPTPNWSIRDKFIVSIDNTGEQ